MNVFIKKVFLFSALLILAHVNPLKANFFFDAKFIYCKALMNDLDYALHVNAGVLDGSLSANIDKLEPDFNWDPGARFEIGYDFGCGWTTSLVGTYIYSRAVGQIGGSLDDISNLVQPLWFQSFTGVRASAAQSTWRLDFATLDLIEMRAFNPWPCLSLVPFFGIRGLYIKQSNEIDYIDPIFTLIGGGTLMFPDGANVDLFSRYLAVGFTSGLDFSVPLRYGFSLNAEVEGSLVYGKSKIHERINGAFPLAGGILIPSQLNLPENKWRIGANFESEASLSYTTRLRYSIVEFSVGYFFSLWFHQNDFFNVVFTSSNLIDVDLSDNFPTTDAKHGNLQMQGVFLRAFIHF